MALTLYRLGRFAFRRAWTVLLSWLLALGLLGGGVLLFGGALQESYEIPGTESQAALDRLTAVFPQVAGASVQLVYRSDDGRPLDDGAHREVIDAMAEQLREHDFVDTVLTPFEEYAFEALDSSGTVGITVVQLAGSETEITGEQLAQLTGILDDHADTGMTMVFGGSIFQDRSFGLTVSEVFGVLFAALVLIITFGSLLSAGMPLLTAILGVGASMALIMIAAGATAVSNTAPMLALMIGLAVGIDYALFILSRHRTQLARGADPEDSAARAVATAGSAVIFAGVTVIVALLGLLVVGIPFLSTMGVAAAAAVLVAMAASVTLLPALLGLAGKRLVPKAASRAARRAEGDARPTMGERWVRLVTKRPVLPVVAVTVLLGVVGIPAFSLQLSLPDNGNEPAGSTQRVAYDVLAEGFGPGRNDPLLVALDITQTTEVLEVGEAVKQRLERIGGVQAVSDGMPNPTLDTMIFQIIPATGAADEATTQTVHEIRALADGIREDYGVTMAVTGVTAVKIDVSTRLGEALVPFGVVVVGLSILLLMLVFRSIWVPLKAAAGFLLTVLASFGVVVAVFQWGFGIELLGLEAAPIMSFLPIILMAVLFGLAMDYEVFLVSGMREAYTHGARAKDAVTGGFASASRVVTAAALIMFFVFAAFVPEGSAMIKPIALGLAIGIAVDAFIVRMTLVPAVMAMLGKHAWWLPAWLARRLPNVDIEGESLGQHQQSLDWAAGHPGVLNFGPVELGTDGSGIELELHLDAGQQQLLLGPAPLRAEALAALTGRARLDVPQAQLAGRPYRSEAAAVRRLARLVDLSLLEALELGGDVGSRAQLQRLLGEHARLGGAGGRRGRAIGGELASLVQRSSPEQRLAATALATALAEQPALLAVECAAASAVWVGEFIGAAGRALARSGVTPPAVVLAAAPGASSAAPSSTGTDAGAGAPVMPIPTILLESGTAAETEGALR